MAVQSRFSMKRFVNGLRSLDSISKVSIVILIGTVTYIVLLFLLKPFFIDPSLPPSHSIVMDNHIMSFDNPGKANLNLFSILGAIISATVTALVLGGKPSTGGVVAHGNTVTAPSADVIDDELQILKKALSSDERKAVDMIEEAKEITQDSLTFRLEWSRAKVSTILTHLERMDIIQRKRDGKTYVVFISKNARK